jgi:Type II secretion system (T2SS), protein M
MTGRDRIVITVLGALAVLVAAWLLAVSPERKQAAALDAQVGAAHAQLATAEGQLANARAAQQQYTAAYTSIVSLGKAVPASQEVPSLIYQLAQASNRKQVEFSSISTTTGGGSSASAAATAAANAASAGFSQMPFTFVFNGSFTDLYNLFQQLNRFTVRTSSGGLQVSGRLLTIQSTKLAPASSPGSGKAGAVTQLTGTVTATAYVLPASQGLTAGATPSSPTGTGASPVAAPGALQSPSTPAIVKVTP